ncbi:MAG: sulfur carrier protein ThiS [Pseudomonadota bacterium]
MTETMQQSLSLTVNGETQTVSSGTTIAGLLSDLGIEGQKVAVEHNRAIAPRSQFAAITLKQGDALEIVRFVGGG